MDKINIKIGDLELRNNFKGGQLKSIGMEIVKWQESGFCFALAYWKGDDLIFVGSRPFNEDWDVFTQLARIGQNIIELNEGLQCNN